MTNTTIIKPEQHIANIRKEFGIDDTLQKRDDRRSRSLHNAVKHLSENLYSKDIHFILEIIQNAEDNQYSDAEPELIFQFTDSSILSTANEGSLLIINNEIGFQQNDIEAICAIGETTKNNRQYGYIGEKGIGFKSTFLVSCEPHIFSAGYSFKFQEEKDPIAGFGYIVPYWVSEIPQTIKDAVKKTCILLPLKKGKRQIVEDQLKSISPETILFLKKIRNLCVMFGKDTIAQVIRIDNGYPIIKLIKDSIEEEYWLTNINFDIPQHIHEVKRLDISSRTMSVALPLGSNDYIENTIFAYLPTSLKSGFNFLINADFILSSNRESVREDLPWNVWLRDCIAPTFINAFESLLKTPEYKFKSYSFIPCLEDITDPFFIPVTEKILEELKTRKIILTENGKTRVEAQKARFASKQLRHLLKGKNLPKQLLETPLVHPALEEEKISTKIRNIGVKNIYQQEVIDCLNDDNWLDEKPQSWFIELYSFLSTQSWATKETLRETSLLLKDGGGRTNGQKNWIYFPTQDALMFLKKYRHIVEYLHIDFLDRKLYNKSKDDTKIISWLEEVLEVESLDLENLCRELISSLSNKVSSIKSVELLRFSRFLCDHLEELNDDVKSSLRASFPLLINTGQIIHPKNWNEENPLVVPEIMDLDSGWQYMFPDTEDREHMTILSSLYLESEPKQSISKRQWIKFFIALGATDAPWPRKRQWKFFYQFPDDVPNHLQHQINLEYSNYIYELSDYAAPFWLKQLTNNSKQKNKIKHAKAIISWIQKQGSISSWDNAKFKWFYRTSHERNYYSEFAYLLRNVAWFPTTQGYKRSSDVFIDKSEIREFFGNTLAYSRIDINNTVANFLDVKTSATLDQVFSLLKNYSSRPAKEVNPKLVARIYGFISERWRSDIEQEIKTKPLILSINPTPAWVYTNQVIWPDRRDVFGDAYVYLAPQYEKMKDFFCDRLGVSSEVSEKEYAQAWLNWTNKPNESSQKIEAALERIYPIIARVSKKTEHPDWWDDFVKKVKIWTQNNKFVDASHVFIPDDGELRGVLEKVGVEFVWRPSKDTFTDYYDLYFALGIRLLSESVNVTSNSGSDLVLKETNDLLLTNAAKLSICYCLRNEMQNQYEKLKNGLIQKLLLTREGITESLNISYQTDGKSVVIDDGVAFWNQENEILVLSKQHGSDEWETEVPSIIARRMVGPRYAKDLENFIGRILRSSDRKIEGIIKKRNWSMPEFEKAWILHILNSSTIVGINEMEKEEQRVEEGEELDNMQGSLDGNDNEKPNNQLKTESGSSGDGGSGGRSDPGGKIAKKSSRSEGWRPRLRSFVEHNDKAGESENSNDSDENNKERDDIEQAGINLVMKYEKINGRYPYVLAHEHKGWDINVFTHPVSEEVSLSGEGAIRRIEVKATKYSWDGWGVGLTAPEFKEAQKYGDNYFLYVVENALDKTHRKAPYIYQNPVSIITDYRFDDNWKKIGIQEDIEL